MTVKELQIAAKKLNLFLITPCYDDEEDVAPSDQTVPTPHKREQAGGQARDQTGNTEPIHLPSHHLKHHPATVGNMAKAIISQENKYSENNEKEKEKLNMTMFLRGRFQ